MKNRFNAIERILSAISQDEVRKGAKVYHDGRVAHLQHSESNGIFARVSGVSGENSSSYIILIVENSTDEEVKATCTCPHHTYRNAPCKHIIASLLYVQQQRNH